MSSVLYSHPTIGLSLLLRPSSYGSSNIFFEALKGLAEITVDYKSTHTFKVLEIDTKFK